MTKRYKIHEESKLGISFAEGRLLTWGDSLVKAWPKGLDEECEELDCFGEVRAAVSTRHSDKTYGKLVFLHSLRSKLGPIRKMSLSDRNPIETVSTNPKIFVYFESDFWVRFRVVFVIRHF